MKNENAEPLINARSMMIQETETELKKIVKNAHLNGHSRRQLSHDTYTAIYRLVRDLDNEDLARRCAISFPRYVNKLNNEYSEVFKLMHASSQSSSPSYVEIDSLGSNTGAAPRFDSSNSSVAPKYADPEREILIQGHNGKVVSIPTLSELSDMAYNRGVAAQTYGGDYMREVKIRLRNVAALAAKEDYSSNVSLRNVAEMQVRYEKHLDDLDSLRRSGTKLVWISTHANCSRRCERFQGKLYSLDGSSGTTPDGVKYEPLEVATDVYYTTKAGVRYKNGLFGFNCRHEMTEYTPGSRPVKIPDEVVKRQREFEKRQREFERAIRYEKNLYEVSRGIGHPETDILSKQAWKRAREINARYREFCKKHNLPYPEERVKVFSGQEREQFKERLLRKNKILSREIPLVDHLTNSENGDTISSLDIQSGK